MLIIPVIDLLYSNVVHAKKGARKKYKPIDSKLTKESDLQNVLNSYFSVYPFKKIYIADLNSIQNKGNNSLLIKRILLKNKLCEFWLDAGLVPIYKPREFSTYNNIRLILGTENNFSQAEYKNITNNYQNLILSLDFGKKGTINNDFLFKPQFIWPKEVIILMLHRVGSDYGIDKELLNNLRDIAKNSCLYVGGGIKNIKDLIWLKEKGFQGALIASSLHNKSITRKELDIIMTSCA